MPAKKYIIDANVLIEASKRHYRFSFCAAFWDFLESSYREGIVCSIDRVEKEIVAETIREWIGSSLDSDFFHPTVTVPNVVRRYSEVLEWVQNEGYAAARVAEFAKGADGWLVAFAKETGNIVVTDENFDLRAKRKVFLPVVCHHFKVQSITTADFLEKLGAKFISIGTR